MHKQEFYLIPFRFREQITRHGELPSLQIARFCMWTIFSGILFISIICRRSLNLQLLALLLPLVLYLQLDIPSDIWNLDLMVRFTSQSRMQIILVQSIAQTQPELTALSLW